MIDSEQPWRMRAMRYWGFHKVTDIFDGKSAARPKTLGSATPSGA